MLKAQGSKTTKFLTVALASAFLTTGLVPISDASAHDRRKAHKHAHKHHKHHKRNNRRNNDGDLIAAGIIGLAIGAIIAGSANDRRYRDEDYYYDRPIPPQPTGYGYEDPYYDGYQGDTYGSVQRQPLSDYSSGYSQPYTDNGPRVVTYEETVSLEPWSQGWYQYCSQKFRSFDPQKGTYRGYDGLDHFCVPK